MNLDAERERLRGLAAACGNHDLSTAEYPDEHGAHECPACEGEGYVEGETFTNYDAKAIGVQFFGVGADYLRYRKLYEAIPAMLTLIDAQASALAEMQERCAKAVEAKVREHAEALPGPTHKLARLEFNLAGTVFAAAIRALGKGT